jgi:putative Ca2+/H+ antiporter (TMEM165/GDT1 family)
MLAVDTARRQDWSPRDDQLDETFTHCQLRLPVLSVATPMTRAGGPDRQDDALVLSTPIIASVFGLILVAEPPDKNAIASPVLSTKYRASSVFTGVAAAFALHTVLAVAAGSP